MMNRRQKKDALIAWAKTWPHLDDYLKLNAILTDEGEASLNTISKETQPEQVFIDGTDDIEYTFQLKLVLPWSDGYDPVNAEALALMEDWMDWVDEQYPSNIPEWDGTIHSIEAVEDEPSVMVYQEESLATYNFIVKISYTE